MMLTGVRINNFRAPHILLKLLLSTLGHKAPAVGAGSHAEAGSMGTTQAPGWHPATLSQGTLGETFSKLGVSAS